MSKNIFLSIIIPAYNEEKNLASTLDEIKSFMDKRGFDYEVIVVDDGSRDRTAEIAEKHALARTGRLKLRRNERNRGKGFSVKRGVQEAAGDYIFFSDADLSTPIAEFDKLASSIENGADIAAGSRSVRLSDVIVKQPLYRQAMGRVFNLLVRCLLGEKIRDTQCGFKLFRKEPARLLFDELSISGFAFDAEILFLARRHGYRIEEIGIKWRNSPESKVHPLLSSLQMIRDILKIKLVHR